MQKLIIYFHLILIGLIGWSNPAENPGNLDTGITICHTGPTEMLAFVDDPEFMKFHPAPLEMDFAGLGEMTTFPTPDGKTASGYLIKASKKSDQWLFVFQEWWGLNDQIKAEADKFYKDLGGKVNVIALDMYDGKVTSNPQEAGGYMRGTDEKRLESIVLGARNMAGKKAEIANVGWCFGGAWSLKSALLLDKQNVGSVIYYGMPVRDVEQLKKLNSDVLGLFATEEYISKAVVEEFAAAMKTAGKDLEYKIFLGVHGFANPSNPKHDPALTQEAYGMALGYLKGKFE